jgi:hypothetical protein
MMKPHITLGRIPSKWKARYRSVGIDLCRGLAARGIDCHLGDDLMISARHALIQWDVPSQHFVITCLSFLTSISVNGREVTYASAPVLLRSRDLIQIGAFYFFFLLPIGTTQASMSDMAQWCRMEQYLPRDEVNAWLRSKKRKMMEHTDKRNSPLTMKCPQPWSRSSPIATTTIASVSLSSSGSVERTREHATTLAPFTNASTPYKRARLD